MNNPDLFGGSWLARKIAEAQGGGQNDALVGPESSQDPTGRPAVVAPRRTPFDLLSLLMTGKDYYTAKGGGNSGWRPNPADANQGIPGQGAVPPNFTVRPGDEGADQRWGVSKWLAGD